MRLAVHFDSASELKYAIAAFKKVLTYKDSPYYDRALYKLAWSYYRDNRFPEAVRQFDNLVKYADAIKRIGMERDQFARDYSVAVRITPQKVRGF